MLTFIVIHAVRESKRMPIYSTGSEWPKSTEGEASADRSLPTEIWRGTDPAVLLYTTWQRNQVGMAERLDVLSFIRHEWLFSKLFSLVYLSVRHEVGPWSISCHSGAVYMWRAVPVGASAPGSIGHPCWKDQLVETRQIWATSPRN